MNKPHIRKVCYVGQMVKAYGYICANNRTVIRDLYAIRGPYPIVRISDEWGVGPTPLAAYEDYLTLANR